MDTKQIAEKLIADAAHLRDMFKGLRGSLRETMRQIPLVVEAVERLAKDTHMAGGQKRDVAVIVLDRLIDIPWIPDRI